MIAIQLSDPPLFKWTKEQPLSVVLLKSVDVYTCKPLLFPCHTHNVKR